MALLGTAQEGHGILWQELGSSRTGRTVARPGLGWQERGSPELPTVQLTRGGPLLGLSRGLGQLGASVESW